VGHQALEVSQVGRNPDRVVKRAVEENCRLEAPEPEHTGRRVVENKRWEEEGRRGPGILAAVLQVQTQVLQAERGRRLSRAKDR